MGLDIGRECRGAGDLSDLQRAGYGCRCQAVDMMQKGNPLSGFGTGTGIWLLVSTLASLAAGVRRRPHRTESRRLAWPAELGDHHLADHLAGGFIGEWRGGAGG